MKNIKKILVTVGTTKFDELIKAFDNPELYKFLDEKNVETILIQKGNGYDPVNIKEKFNKLKIVVVDYITKDFEEEIKNSDLVVAHCGAGTILECFKHKKLVLGTVNDSLLNNHQEELRDVLIKNKYILFSETNKIFEAIKNIFEKGIDLNEYPNFDYDYLPNLIDEMLDN